jgi:hypothetical protein
MTERLKLGAMLINTGNYDEAQWYDGKFLLRGGIFAMRLAGI